MSRAFYFPFIWHNPLNQTRTVSRKNFVNVSSFIDEPESRAQCSALEDNVKEFGLTYFGMTDRRQGVYNLCAATSSQK